MSEIKSVPTPATDSESPAPMSAPQESVTRRAPHRVLLLVVVPAVAVMLGMLIYLNTGRYESTENAYVKSHIANVSPEVEGRIIDILVEENERVEAGETLFVIDDVPYQLALNEAKAKLAQTETDIEADRSAYLTALSEAAVHQAAVTYATAQLARQQHLIEKDLGRKEDLDTAHFELENAQRRVAMAQQNARALLAKLNGDPDIAFDAHPAWQSGALEVAKAELDVERTHVRAPFAGMIAKRPELGTYVFPFMAAIAVVADEDLWIEANFKETQLTHMRPGQGVEFTVDAYPGESWHGQVESISRSTGAQFAMLPPQNATGNWVKIVQRVPVRITVKDEHPQLALRAGMSCEATIDTEHQRRWRDLITGW